jgi:REP element-mobilizing transposase RayT
VFDARAIDVLRGIFADVCSHAQATLVEMDGEDDHVHLLARHIALDRFRAARTHRSRDLWPSF